MGSLGFVFALSAMAGKPEHCFTQAAIGKITGSSF
jgi:hypothetical protein